MFSGRFVRDVKHFDILYELVQENSKLTCQGVLANLGELLFQYVL